MPLARNCHAVVTLAASLGIALFASILPSREAQADSWEWTNEFAGDGPGGFSHAMAIFDEDGAGPHPPALYIGGSFSVVSGMSSPLIARWDATWSRVGAGLTGGEVVALEVFDEDGDGPMLPALFAAGKFAAVGVSGTYNIARWDGVQWTSVGGGLTNNPTDQVLSLQQFDPDGSGPAAPVLIAAGWFSTVGGVACNNIAQWNGVTWSPLLQGLNNVASGVCVLDSDGEGPIEPVLVVSGQFTTAGGTTALRVATWDGGAWATLGEGFNASAYELAVYDSGAGPEVYAAGDLSASGTTPLNHIARWDGKQWLDVGGGISTKYVRGMFVHDEDGTGPLDPVLFVGGDFVTIGAMTVNHIARWNGVNWSPVGTGVIGSQSQSSIRVDAFAPFDEDGPGPLPAQLVVAGYFSMAGGYLGGSPAKWTGTAWIPFGRGFNNSVSGLGLLDSDGPGGAPASVVASGSFTHVDGVAANRIAQWDGSTWSPMGDVLGEMRQFMTFDLDGPGPLPPRLTACGAGVVQWDGAQWEQVGPPPYTFVYAIAAFDEDGDGPASPALYAGGPFTSIGGVSAPHIARFNGTTWTSVGGGTNAPVLALTVFDPDEAGPQPAALIAGGRFMIAGTTPVSHIARWDGQQWSALGAGVGDSSLQDVLSLMACPASSGLPAGLYVSGTFPNAGAITVGGTFGGLARWDGDEWFALPGFDDGRVLTMNLFDLESAGSTSKQLILGASVSVNVNSTFLGNLVAWNGTTWSTIEAGMSDDVRVLLPIPDELGLFDGPSLMMAGAFNHVGVDVYGPDVASAQGAARLTGRAPMPCPADIAGGDGQVDVNDLLAVITTWGACPLPCPPNCAADIAPNCAVDVNDLLAVITTWGACP